MKEFGDNIGFCLHFQTADDIANEMASDEMDKGTKKKKEELVRDFRKKIGDSDQLRALIFKDGMCINGVE